MSIIKYLNLKPVFLALILVSVSSYANTDKTPENASDLSPIVVFPPKDGKIPPLQGNIEAGRYHAPKNVFSCQAYNFGEFSYTAQDVLFKDGACVGFYSSFGDFKKAEVMILPGAENKKLDKIALKDAFEGFCIGILKTVDSAEGIEVLQEEMVGDMYFTAISIDKMSVAKTRDGKPLSTTRGYLVFQDKDKLVFLSNQEVTLPFLKHTPKKNVKRLRKDILEFRKTFKFGPIFISQTTEEAEIISS